MDTRAIATQSAPRIDIDWTGCVGHGLCAELLPEHITLDEWGCPLADGRPLPPRTVKRARKAAAACPVLALKIG
ncbi:ferredoxin [Actinacidiphila oryziradicis]|uniref:ferredoxin n=1 Tax=Actinacidiphila oryziradicis TaxID=2571141 RepID=UPI0023F47E1D|nr:ferredoxin [Actinacidiphila oryziradicis]MCW2871056.1 ferredoxin [Actinacidiphila oryziradicis]